MWGTFWDSQGSWVCCSATTLRLFSTLSCVPELVLFFSWKPAFDFLNDDDWHTDQNYLAPEGGTSVTSFRIKVFLFRTPEGCPFFREWCKKHLWFLLPERCWWINWAAFVTFAHLTPDLNSNTQLMQRQHDLTGSVAQIQFSTATSGRGEAQQSL